MIDIEPFCGVLDDSHPAGADLEYDPEFMTLELAQKGKAERQYGDTVIPAEAPDWKQVFRQASQLAARTRDLRVACALTRALTHLHGMPGLVCGLQLTDRLCRELWEHVFPVLDETEDNDPTLRMNALAPLSDRSALLADIRACTFASARGVGSCTVRQLEVALGILEPSADGGIRVLNIGEVDAIIASAKAEGTFTENHAQQALVLAQGLHAYLSELVGVEQAPDLQPLLSRLRPIAEYGRKFVAGPYASASATDAPAQGGVPAAHSGTAGVAAAAMQAPGEIRSSQDAARMLDVICAYFEKNEPTNPAPLLLRRAQKLSTMSFYDIVRDIAPDAISSVDMVAGSRAES